MSLEPHHGSDTTGRHLVLEPDRTGRQTVREPARRTFRTLRPTAASVMSFSQTDRACARRRIRFMCTHTLLACTPSESKIGYCCAPNGSREPGRRSCGIHVVLG